METNNTKPNIIDELKAYAQTRYKLAKYESIDKGTSIVAEIIADVALIFFSLIAFIFTSITLGCYLAEVLKSDWAGFGCVALLYTVIGIVVIISKKRFEQPIISALVKKLLK